MFRIAVLLTLLLGAGSPVLQVIWERTGPSSDPLGSPNGQSQPPSADSGPDIDPLG